MNGRIFGGLVFAQDGNARGTLENLSVGGDLVLTGDTAPCASVVEAATGADVLVHDAHRQDPSLAFALARERPSLYLDLESERDRARLSEPELYLAGHQDKLVILDEVHRLPALFPLLRGLIFDSEGRAMSPSHSRGRGGQMYRYYVSQAVLKGSAADDSFTAVADAPRSALGCAALRVAA